MTTETSNDVITGNKTINRAEIEISSEKKADMSSPSEKVSDKDVFCVPLLPSPSAQKITKKTPATAQQRTGPAVLDYTPPEWSSKPPAIVSPDQLDDEGFCDHYYLEVIKTGTVLESIQLAKSFSTFGRLDLCDVLCEHPSLSRFHTVLQYSNGEVDPKFPKGFYAYDLNSTHGTFVNKKRIESNTYIPVNIDSILKFGLSTRMYILHGPKPTNNSDDLTINLSHEEMKRIKQKQAQVAMKLRARKEVEEEEMSEMKRLEETESAMVNWGMRDLEDEQEENDNGEENPFAVVGEIGDESYYSSDPKKALRIYFEREGEDLEYDVEDLSSGKFKCSIRLPISNKMGAPMYAEVTHDGKKKECVAQCALEACRILDSEGVLRQSRQESQRKKKEKDWEEADYYDSDEDNFLDRTGSVERKRLRRMAQAGKLDEKTSKSMPGLLKNKVHTFESLLSDMKVLITEQKGIENKLEKCKAVFKAVQEDDLDSYIESLKVGTIDTVTRAKFKRRLVEIKMEINKLDKMLNVAKPKDFDAKKWKKDLEDKLCGQDVVRETGQLAQEPLVQRPKIQEERVSQEEIRIEKKTPAVEVVEEIKEVEMVEEKIENTHEESVQMPEVEHKVRVESKKKQLASGENGQMAKKQKVEVKSEEKFEEYSSSADYAVWLPPEDQTGDGKTKLNEKYGY